MSPLLIAVLGVVVVAVAFAVTYLVRSYCRVRGVEEDRAWLWVWARPIGVFVGAAVWTILRFVTPEVGTPVGDYPLWLHALSAFVTSGVLLGVLEIATTRLFVDEPSFGEARELYLDHGSCEASGQDWIDVAFDGEEGKA